MTREEMDAVLNEHFRAEAAKDLGAILATLTEDAEHDAVGDPTGVLHGHEAISQRYTQLFGDLAIDQIKPLRRYHGTDFVVDECLVEGRATGMMLGIPGDNRPITFRLLHVCEFSDGRMSRENVWLDTGAILAQLDALPGLRLAVATNSQTRKQLRHRDP